MSNATLCTFIQPIPRMTTIPCPLSIIRVVLNIRPVNSSDACGDLLDYSIGIHLASGGTNHIWRSLGHK
jgi:hypothetical protein